MLELFARTLFGWLRRRARELGTEGGEAAAVTFLQRFGSALQVNVHFHLLAPEGVFTPAGTFVPLPPPDDEEVRALLEAFVRRLQALLERWDLEALTSSVAACWRSSRLPG